MKVIHIDGYTAGKQQGFEGSEIYLIACCGMCTFTAVEPVLKASAKTFASAIMKIMLQYGLSHTVVLDKDSKFFGVCRESLDLLHINCHILSGGNHNPMLVKRVNPYLNKGLKIMTNKRDSIRVALKAILLLICACSSCPVPSTDISRSLVAVGREFQFPINFSSGKAAALISAPGSVESYSRLLAECLSACHEVALLLVCKQRCWHRKLVNSQRRDPRTYNIGNIVFARRATRSDSKRGLVNKLMYAFTGLWCVTASLPSASYELQHVHHPTHRDKKHAFDLSLYPVELIPFQPLDGADTRYGQLYKPIGLSPFKEAGLKGFQPSTPFHVFRITSKPAVSTSFIGQLSPSSTTTLYHFRGLTTKNAASSWTATIHPSNQFYIMDLPLIMQSTPHPPFHSSACSSRVFSVLPTG
jgi:hypothetical protein